MMCYVIKNKSFPKLWHVLHILTWKPEKGSQVKSADPDQTPHNVASDQSLHFFHQKYNKSDKIDLTSLKRQIDSSNIGEWQSPPVYIGLIAVGVAEIQRPIASWAHRMKDKAYTFNVIRLFLGKYGEV